MRLTTILNAQWAGWPLRRPQSLTARAEDELTIRQFLGLRDNIRTIYMVIAIIVIAATIANDSSMSKPLLYLFPGIILVASAFQMARWSRHKTLQPTVEHARCQLGRTTILSSIMVAFSGGWAILAFANATPGHLPFTPVFLLFGAFAVSNCLTILPRAALAVLAIGLGPVSLAMFASADTAIKALAVAVLVVAMLQARLVMTRFSELTDNLMLQSELADLARTDPLTGLLNRRAFGERLDTLIKDGKGASFVVAMLDLDRFKPVNDAHGHAAGDALLCALSARLIENCREGDLIARLGGDEFAVVFDAPRDEHSLAARIGALSEKLARPYRIAGNSVTVTASIGCATFPKEGKSADGLLLAADNALYRSKALSRAENVRKIIG